LLLAEHGADLSHSRSQGYLEVRRHNLLALVDGPLLLGLAHHGLNPLDSTLAFLEAPRNFLRQLFDFALLPLLDRFVVEPREHVLLVQLVELPRLLRYLGQLFRHLVLDVQPSRGEQVHLNHRVAVVFKGSLGHEAQSLLRHAPAFAIAVRPRAAISRFLCGMVRVRLAVGNKAVQASSANAVPGMRAAWPTGLCGRATWRRQITSCTAMS
jgi:hypothetical protein